MVKSGDENKDKILLHSNCAKKTITRGQIREFPKMKINNNEYRVLDCVKVREFYDDCCYAKILKIYLRNNEPYIRIRWFYKPSDILNPVPDYLAVGELFDSDVENEVYACTIYDKITILTLEEYDELDSVEPDTFFCRAKYISSTQEIDPPIES